MRYCLAGTRERATEFVAQKIDGVPESYMALRGLVLDLVEELDAARAARKHFKAAVAQKALDELLGLVIEAAMEISRCYSRGKISTFVSFKWLAFILTFCKSLLRRKSSLRAQAA